MGKVKSASQAVFSNERSRMIVSFCIPAFNEEALIVNCIKSIQRAACNVDHEIILVDNGSTDNTTTLAKNAGAIVYFEPNKGVTRARQAGLNHCSSDLISFVDADSELPEDWLEHALTAIKPLDVVAASGPVIYYELALHKRLFSFVFYCFARVIHIWKPMLQGGNFILRKQALLDAGGFNTSIDFYGEDTDTAIRLSKQGKVVFDMDMWVYTSARRMQKEGMIRTGFRYFINYVWMYLSGEPWTVEHYDHRPK